MIFICIKRDVSKASLFFIFTRMKKNIYLLTICLFLFAGKIFSQTAKELQETARSFMQQGDYANALLVLNRAVQMEPQNVDIYAPMAR